MCVRVFLLMNVIAVWIIRSPLLNTQQKNKVIYLQMIGIRVKIELDRPVLWPKKQILYTDRDSNLQQQNYWRNRNKN